jgi:hypothetical protein
LLAQISHTLSKKQDFKCLHLTAWLVFKKKTFNLVLSRLKAAMLLRAKLPLTVGSNEEPFTGPSPTRNLWGHPQQGVSICPVITTLLLLTKTGNPLVQVVFTAITTKVVTVAVLHAQTLMLSVSEQVGYRQPNIQMGIWALSARVVMTACWIASSQESVTSNTKEASTRVSVLRAAHTTGDQSLMTKWVLNDKCELSMTQRVAYGEFLVKPHHGKLLRLLTL